MSDIALRPRSSTELVDAGFQLLRRDPLPFIAGLALVYLPWFVIMTATHLMEAVLAFSQVNPDRALSMAAMSPVLYLGLGNVIVQALGMAIVTVLANEAYFGRPLPLGKAARDAFFRSHVIVIAAIVIALPLAFGFILFFLPGLYLLARWFALPAAAVLEDAGPLGALGRSWTLTKGQVRHVINTMGLVMLLEIAVSYGANLIALLLPGQVIRVLFGVVVSCIAQPMIGIVATLLYYDIRIRREGFDIEFLAAASPANEPSTVA